MLLALTLTALAEPVVLDLSAPPLPQPAAPGCMLLTEVLVGIGQTASPYQITGPTQSATAYAWQCLGVDNATLDVASRCPFVGMTRRAPRIAE